MAHIGLWVLSVLGIAWRLTRFVAAWGSCDSPCMTLESIIGIGSCV